MNSIHFCWQNNCGDREQKFATENVCEWYRQSAGLIARILHSRTKRLKILFHLRMNVFQCLWRTGINCQSTPLMAPYYRSARKACDERDSFSISKQRTQNKSNSNGLQLSTQCGQCVFGPCWFCCCIVYKWIALHSFVAFGKYVHWDDDTLSIHSTLNGIVCISNEANGGGEQRERKNDAMHLSMVLSLDGTNSDITASHRRTSLFQMYLVEHCCCRC